MSPFSSLRRHLSASNLIACLALFLALSGGAYAAAKINGNSIKAKSIGAGKLKDETITSKQIKKGTLNSSVINISSLATVPSAETAQSAQTAVTANSAATAAKADTAASAQKASSAETAGRADYAEEAGRADTAGDAETVDGLSADDLADELTVVCPADTELYGGMCWDDEQRPGKSWFVASKECGDAGGRLPSISELLAFVTREGTQAVGYNWSDDVIEYQGGAEKIATRDELNPEAVGAGNALGFRCLFYRVN